jgi:hypothetical protein
MDPSGNDEYTYASSCGGYIDASSGDSGDSGDSGIFGTSPAGGRCR